MLIEQHLAGLAAARWLWFHPPVFLMLSPGVPPPPAARGGVSHRTRRSFCRIRFELTPRGLRLKNTHFESTKTTETSPAVCRVSPGSCTDLQECLTLLERIRSLLPDVDAMKYKTTESHFDWEKVGFGLFSGEMCRSKWLKVSTEVRKYRTMTEVIVDATEFVRNPYKGKKLKKRAKYAKIHPEMSNLDLTKILSKKYKELPEKKKVRTPAPAPPRSALSHLSLSLQLKYITEFQREKEEHDHPDLIEERKKSDLPEKPKTPQQLWYNHEKKTYLKLHPEVSQKELKEALRRQWSQLSDKRRLSGSAKPWSCRKTMSMRAYHVAHPDVSPMITCAPSSLKQRDS
ncbi:hypothetical protein F7725_010750 [Dissostichus mawsoni]|uniref:HMG box domain-containing protein n=1 Tax=Dissostichus mawsoni TaxID=36200 RepID=A0A7J5Z925_DISMA|nr:hypothetical protein F7725_010750 [Dissostichus mawsoni]